MYTTQGYMTAADYADHLADTDQGATSIDLADPPAWFDTEQRCPVCDTGMHAHDAVRVIDASGEIFACLPTDGGDWRELPSDERVSY